MYRRASSSPDTFMIPTTGPNDSSRITLIEWSTPTSTVGPTYGVPGREPANPILERAIRQGAGLIDKGRLSSAVLVSQEKMFREIEGFRRRRDR